MPISRQSDSIWHTAAMGEGRQDRPHSETHHKAVQSSHDYGRSMGERHASEAWRWEHRDDHGRFAPTPEHHQERFEQEGREPRGEQRDKFVEGYHVGFSNHIAKKEKEGREKKESSLVRQAVEVDPYTRELHLNDGLDWFDKKHMPREDKMDRFRHYLENGTYEGWEPKTTFQRQDEALSPEDEYQSQDPVNITDRNPAASELNTLTRYAKGVHGIELGDKYPFSDRDMAVMRGEDPTRRSRARGKLPKGSLASSPMQTVDKNGVAHTLWHHVSTEWPSHRNAEGEVQYTTDYVPESKRVPGVRPRVGIALHHFRSDTGLQLPMTSYHTLDPSEQSTARETDLNGMFRTNDQTRSLYDLGMQRTGDWKKDIKFRYNHPNGKIWYDVQRVNGDDSRYPGGGRYYDPDLSTKKLLGEEHPDYVGEKWVVTPHTQERLNPFDVRSEMRDVAHSPVEFPADDDHGFNAMIDHVKGGLGSENAKPYADYEQNQMPNEGGAPPGEFVPHVGATNPGRSAQIRPWVPEHNIHRSRERLPSWPS